MSDVQLINAEIFEYLRYFGDKGYAPRILSYRNLPSVSLPTVYGDIEIEQMIVNYEHVPGPRLRNAMAEYGDDRLQAIFDQLGLAVGFISKYLIEHGHLHTENVIVAERPVLIDWGMARLNPHLKHDNLKQLLDSAELNDGLAESFNSRYLEELAQPLELQHDEILMKYNPFLSRLNGTGLIM